jgi:hypothetical protein
MATSVTLKCSVSKPLLDDLEKSLQKLDLEAGDFLSNMRENDVSIVSNDTPIDIVNSTISFRVPQVMKGPKSKRAKNIVEKKTRKKKRSSQEKGTDCCMHYFFTISCFVNSYKYILVTNNVFISYMSESWEKNQVKLENIWQYKTF